MLADRVWWTWIGMGLGHVWEQGRTPPLGAGYGWEDVPGTSGGYTLVRVGEPGVHMDKPGT